MKHSIDYYIEHDDGWSKIVKVDDQYYMVQQGLQEYEGHVYMCQVKITAIEILN